MASDLQEQPQETIIAGLKEGQLPTPPTGIVLVDLGYRLDLRAESPDESVPAGGKLLGFAYVSPIDDVWHCRVRYPDPIFEDEEEEDEWEPAFSTTGTKEWAAWYLIFETAQAFDYVHVLS